ncbi:MAG: DMT family transporter [Candidatus Azobacteroides sp.]|nr:DMT family transporter [Candidatus Azobacteroides sp.]
MKKTNKILGIGSALISSATFGMIPLFTIPLMMTARMGESPILFYRYLIAAIAVWILCKSEKKDLRISLPIFGKLLGLGTLYAATGMALIYSYTYISSGIVTTIHFLYPVLVAFFMILFYKEKSSGHLFIAGLLTIIGVSALSWTGKGFSNPLGIMLALSTAITYALYIVGLNLKGIRETDSNVIIFYVLLFCSVIFGFLSAFTTGIHLPPNGKAWINLLLLALIPTVISNLFLVKAVKYAGSTMTSILGSAEPLVAVTCGVLVFSESFTSLSFIGLIMIIAAVTYVIMFNNRQKMVES